LGTQIASASGVAEGTIIITDTAPGNLTVATYFVWFFRSQWVSLRNTTPPFITNLGNYIDDKLNAGRYDCD